MPKVHFASFHITVEVPKGARLPDIVDEKKVAFPFGCRMGSCGTCRCLIEEGVENLNTKTKQEEELFENFTSVGKNERLGCQIVINGDVKIRS